MSSEVIFIVIIVIIAIVGIFFTIQKRVPKIVKTKKQKKAEIIDAYKKELSKSRQLLQQDQKARVAKKMQLLKKFSDELALNIFFDANEVREIILELSKED